MKRRTSLAALPLVLGGALLLTLPGAQGQPGFQKGFDKKGGPGGFGPMGGPARKLVKEFDKDGDGRLNADERKLARAALQKERAKGGMGGMGKGGFGKGGPGGFGPVGLLSRQLREAIDDDEDGLVSKTELAAGIKTFFARADKGKKGELTEAQLSAALTAILPTPRFGPPPTAEPGKVLTDGAQERLELSARQKKEIQALQKDVDTKLSRILTDEQRRSLKELRDEQPGGMGGQGGGFGKGGKGGPGGPGGGFGKGGPGGPGGFFGGVASALATAAFRRADADKSGKVTLKGLQAAAEAALKEADANKDGKLDESELGAAISAAMPPPTFGPFGREPAKPGPKVSPADVKTYPDAGLFSPNVLRTVFIEFEDRKDWEGELADFKGTDVEVPATVTVDGVAYKGVGVHFRGMSSFGMVQAGHKRSLNLSFDFTDGKQRLYGYRTLNLLNGADDPSFLHAVLYSHLVRKHIPAPRANVVKVVINGESWGLYASAEQFNKDFLQAHFKTDKGTRWKVRGNPGARGGLEYLGDDVEAYKRIFTVRGKDDDKAWKALVNLCKVLNQTPPEKLEAALKPILDLDGVLWFLALDVALINNDGYWTRASDYSIYLDPKGKFHIVPHDMNEAFGPAMMFGFGGGGPGGGMGGPTGGAIGVNLDPLVGLTDARKPLRSKLLAVPALRERYLKYIKEIAEKDLDWKALGPVVAGYRKLIEKEVELDTRKLYSLAAFKAAVADAPGADRSAGPVRQMSLRDFADGRREYLLRHKDIKALAPGGEGGK